MDMPEINLKSASRFSISVGLVLLILAGIITYYLIITKYSQIKETILVIYGIIFWIFGAILVLNGHSQLLEEEQFLRKYKQELIVTQVFEQEIKNEERKIKNIEYNLQVHVYNGKYKDIKYTTAKFRDMDSIGRQILDKNFYENTYKTTKKKE